MHISRTSLLTLRKTYVEEVYQSTVTPLMLGLLQIEDMRRSTYRSSVSLPASVRESKLYHKSKDSSKSWAERIVQLNIETGLMIFYASKGGARLQKDRITLKGAEFSLVDESISERKFSMLLHLTDGSSEIIAADNTDELNKWTEWITGYLGNSNYNTTQKDTEKSLASTLFSDVKEVSQSNKQETNEGFTFNNAFQDDASDSLNLGSNMLHNPLASESFIMTSNPLQVSPLKIQPPNDNVGRHSIDITTESVQVIPPDAVDITTESIQELTINDDISIAATDSVGLTSNLLQEIEPQNDDVLTTHSIDLTSSPLQHSILEIQPPNDYPLSSQSNDSTLTENVTPRVTESASIDNGDADNSTTATASQKKLRQSATIRRSSSIVSEGVRQALLEISYKDSQTNSYDWNLCSISLDINTGIVKISSDKGVDREEDIKGRNAKSVSSAGKNFVMGIYGINEDEGNAILIACQNKDSFRDWSIWIKTCTSMARGGQDPQISVRRKSVATEKAPVASKTALPSKSSSIVVKRNSVIIAKIDSIEFKVTQIKTPLMGLTRRLHLWYEHKNYADSNELYLNSLQNSTDEAIASVALALNDQKQSPEWLDSIDILRVYEKTNPLNDKGNSEIIYYTTVNISSINVSVNLEISSKESVISITKKLLKQIPSEYYVNEEDLRKKVTVAVTKENNNISQQVTEILLEDLRNMQEIILSHEDTIDSLRDEISSIDQLGLEAEANLRRKENEKIALQSEVESLRARVKDNDEQMVAIALSAQEHVEELQGQIALFGSVDVAELQLQLASALEREEDLNGKIEKLNASTSTRVEELSAEIQSFQRLIDTRYEEVKRSESARIVLEDELVRVDMVTDKLKIELERANSIIAELKRENQQLEDEKNVILASQQQHPENNDVNVDHRHHSPKAQASNNQSLESIRQHSKTSSPKVNKDERNRNPGFLSPTSSHKAKSKDSLVSAQIIDSTTPLRVAGIWK